MTTPIPDEAIAAAAQAIGNALITRESMTVAATWALEGAAPLVRADERERVAAALRRAMGDNASLHLCRHMLDGHSCGGRTLADLLGEESR